MYDKLETEESGSLRSQQLHSIFIFSFGSCQSMVQLTGVTDWVRKGLWGKDKVARLWHFMVGPLAD